MFKLCNTYILFHVSMIYLFICIICIYIEIPQSKIYYLNLQFINKYEQSIATVSWVVNGKTLIEDVNPGSELFVNSAFISESTPLPSNLTGFIKGTTNKVLLNGQTVLPVLASQQQNTLSITIGEGIKSLILYYSVLWIFKFFLSNF